MMKKMFDVKQLLFILCCTLLASCAKAPVMPETTYACLAIENSDKTVTNEYSATIKGRQDIAIMPQVGGTLTKLCVKEGEKVKKGQVMFIIDQVPYKAAYETAKANVEAATAAYETANLNYESRQELYKENVVSEFDLKTAKNSMLAAKAQLSQAKAQMLNAENSLSYTEVKSPADGVVGTLPYRVGALVGPSMMQPLTTVSDNSDMYVYFSMTENQLLAMVREYGSKENALKNMPEIDLRLNDKSIYNQKGKIETISGVIDPATGTVSLRAIFPNKDGLLHSGGAGSVMVPVTYKDAVVIPQNTSYELQHMTFVYKVVDGKAVANPIQVLRVDGGKEYIVEMGLYPGDTIVAEGVALLREGTPIKPKQAPAQPTK